MTDSPDYYSSEPSRPIPPPSRRRDKPQLSCNLCRRRKLKCDRGQPCQTCARRGLPCTYVTSNPSKRTGHDQVRPSPTTDPNIPDRIGQLERMVTSLMSNAKPTVQSSSGTQSLAYIEFPAVSGQESEEYVIPHDSSQLPGLFGRVTQNATGTTYVESTHWSAILGGIPEVKDCLQDDHNSNVLFPEAGVEPDFLFGHYDRMSKQEILATIPSRPTIDRLVAEYFNNKANTSVAIHSPTFLKQYEQFWDLPQETPIMWIGMLFGVMCMAAFFQHPVTLAPDSSNLIQSYREKVIQCLVHGRYTRCPPYTIETLLLYLDTEYLRCEDGDIQTWILLGVIVRLALLMGYHRDANHFAQFSPFQGEMRRRVWALIVQYDGLASSQLGLPGMIREIHADTGEPLNVLDEDLDENISMLPSPRPHTVQTPIQFTMARNRIITLYGRISDLTTRIRPTSYTEVKQLDQVLRDAYASIPQGLHIRPVEKSFMDTPAVIIYRLCIAFLYQKALCVLHYPYMILARTDSRYAYSRTVCIEAALKILEHQSTLHRETQPGGRLDQWKPSAFKKGVFLHAISVLCVELNCNITSEISSSCADSEMGKQISQALNASFQIWIQWNDPTREARTAVEVLSVVLSKAQTMNIRGTGDFRETGESTTGVDSESSGFQHESPLWVGGLPTRQQARGAETSSNHPTSIHQLMRINTGPEIAAYTGPDLFRVLIWEKDLRYLSGVTESRLSGLPDKMNIKLLF